MNISNYIDHTFLKPAGDKDAVRKLCAEAKKAKFASVCVNPCEVETCARILRTSPVKVCTVIDFPLGQGTNRTRCFEALDAIQDGADELDLVVNQRLLKFAPGRCEAELLQWVRTCRTCRSDVTLKLILECCNLTKKEIALGCKIAQKVGFDFVKTSTGFGTGGATIEDVELMRKTVGKKMGVKAAGGIRDRKTALAMVAAGATRIGTSAGLAIQKGTAACLLAGLVLLGGDVFAAEPINTVMPYSLGAGGGGRADGYAMTCQRRQKKWQIVPARTNRCQTMWA